jgi:hypothetical protein
MANGSWEKDINSPVVKNSRKRKKENLSVISLKQLRNSKNGETQSQI